jgi:hypothetical protein
MVLVFVEVRLFVVMSEDAVSVQVPRWSILVVRLVNLAHVESEVVRDLPVVLGVVPREISELALHVVLNVLLSIFVLMQVSAQTLVRTLLRRLSLLALLNFVHLRA